MITLIKDYYYYRMAQISGSRPKGLGRTPIKDKFVLLTFRIFKNELN